MDNPNAQLPIYLIRRVGSRLCALMLNFNTVERDVLYVILATSQDELCAAIEFYTNEVSPFCRINTVGAPPPFYQNFTTFQPQIQSFPEQAQVHQPQFQNPQYTYPQQ